MPLLPPVTTIVLPERSGMSSAVQDFLSGMVNVPPRRLDESYHTIGRGKDAYAAGGRGDPCTQYLFCQIRFAKARPRDFASSHSREYRVQGSPLPPTPQVIVLGVTFARAIRL